jgi:hypothetical protein
LVTTKTKVPPSNGSTAVKIHAPKKLDIGCGQNKQTGFKGIDIAGDADIFHDLWETPWPIKTSSVEEAFSSHLVEHIPHWRPGWDRDGWWRFFDELHRVMKKDGVVQIIHPYTMSVRAFWDPTHTRYIHEMTWYYLDPAWRAANGLDHYPVTCDFEVVVINGVGITDEITTRNAEQQAFSRNHYWNVIPDLHVTLKARK